MSITVADTWDLTMEWDAQTGTTRRGSKSDPRNGALFRRQLQTSSSEHRETASRRKWSPRWRMATSTQESRLRELWKNSRAGVLPIAFTPPEESSAVNVLISPGSLSSTQRNGEFFEMGCELVEVP